MSASIRKATRKAGGWQLAWNEADRQVWGQVLEAVKGIQGRRFDPRSKTWMVPLDAEPRLRALGFTIDASEGKAITAPDLDLSTVEIDLGKVHPKMFPLQVDWIRMLVANDGRAINTDAPGAGKTVMALGAIDYFKDYPALIITTAPTKMQWARQFSKWCKGEPVQLLEGITPYPLRPITTVVNWEILQVWAGTLVADSRGYERFRYDGELSKIPWKCVVMDEFHKHLGDPSSKRSKTCRAITRVTPHVQPLSGTPIRTRPAQFFPILNMVRPEEFQNSLEYLQRYCDPKSNGFGLSYNGASNIEELHARIKPFMLRRTIEQLQPDLPPVLPVIVPLSVSNPSGTPLVERMRSCFDLKRESCLAWVEDFLESGESLLLFAHHRNVVEWLMERLKKHKPVKVYGGQSSTERESLKTAFIKGQTKLMIANIEAAGTGIDGLQHACRSVAFAEFAQTPTDMEQAYKRLHRTGQKSCVNAYYLVAQGIVDDEVRAEILDERANTMSKLIDGQGLPEEDFMSLMIKRRQGKKDTNAH